MFKLIRQSVLSTLCLAVLLCAAYPMLVTGAADAFFPKEAAGSLILRDGAIVGSALIGQPFSSAKYFHPRPSAAGTMPVPPPVPTMAPPARLWPSASGPRNRSCAPSGPKACCPWIC